MAQILVVHRVARLGQMIKRGLHVAGFPHPNHVQQEAQAGGAIQLTRNIVVGERPVLPMGQVSRQTVHRFALVEHASHAVAVGRDGYGVAWRQTGSRDLGRRQVRAVEEAQQQRVECEPEPIGGATAGADLQHILRREPEEAPQFVRGHSPWTALKRWLSSKSGDCGVSIGVSIGQQRFQRACSRPAKRTGAGTEQLWVRRVAAHAVTVAESSQPVNDLT